jgi:uncharacterized protein YndB with AHSA1/START domain
MEMSDSRQAVITLPSDTEILITRQFDAPKHLVYKAWTTPDLIKRWWSGDRGTVTIAEVDLRVGGEWRYVMTANQGLELAFHGRYREIVPNEHIVSTAVFEMPGAEAIPEEHVPVNTVTFAESDGQTTLTVLTRTTSKDMRDGIISSGMEDGMQEQMDHIEELLASQQLRS